MNKDKPISRSVQEENYGFMERFKLLGLLIIIIIFILNALFLFLNINTRYDPPYLLLFLNVIFISIPSFIIGFIGFRGFLRTGTWAVLWLGIGALTFGIATLSAGLLITVTSVNVTLTAFNTIIFISALLFLTGGFFILNRIPRRDKSGRSSTALYVYLGVLIIVIFIIIISLLQVLPPYFIPGTGGTAIRSILVSMSSIFLFIASMMILRQYFKSKSLLLYWYSLGLLSMSLGIGGILFLTNTGTPLNWMARIAQMVGGVYLLMAARVALKTARIMRVSAGEAFSSFFQWKESNVNTLLENVKEAIILTDLNFNITGWNKAAEDIYGWKFTEVENKSLLDILPPISFETSQEKMLVDALSEGYWKGEVIHKNKNGRQLNIITSISPLKDNENNIISIMAINRDITENKRANNALKEARDNLELKVQERTEKLQQSKERFRTLAENSPDLIIRLDKNLKYTYVNSTLTKITGKSPEDYIGKTYEEAGISMEYAKLWAEKHQNLLKTGISQHYEYEFPTINGLRTLENISVPEYNKNNEIESILIIVRDITERRKAEEQLKETISELGRSNEELESFAYITSHDLQEPLRTIASYAQLINRRYRGQLDKDADEFLSFMVSGSKRMKEQIQGLLDYSRVGKGEEFRKFNTEEALDDALDNLKYSIEDCKAEVTYDALPEIFGDRSQITRVFQNLIGNALKFRKEGVQPIIHISAKKEENEYIFSVNDNGIGIEEQYTDRIFEVFKRLHTIGEYQGAGIGLAIVKRIIGRHGGRVWVESSFGVGSTFYFTIPFK
ncbi:PAS domain S-box protein [Methanobacterium sp. ACI-7]|uniref:PAS domain S-box protein n=1 Tax=unclassified Methanobacterium TaxID=2627676 RepID=UPI0039C3D87B